MFMMSCLGNSLIAIQMDLLTKSTAGWYPSRPSPLLLRGSQGATAALDTGDRVVIVGSTPSTPRAQPQGSRQRSFRAPAGRSWSSCGWLEKFLDAAVRRRQHLAGNRTVLPTIAASIAEPIAECESYRRGNNSDRNPPDGFHKRSPILFICAQIDSKRNRDIPLSGAVAEDLVSNCGCKNARESGAGNIWQR